MNKEYSSYNNSIDYSIEAAADFYMDDHDNYKKPNYQHRDCKPNDNAPVKSCDDNISVIGNSVNFCVNSKDSEIKADVIVGYRNSVRVWGQVKDCDGKPIGCAYVKLVKMTSNGLVGIAHTVSDCLGFYQFDICPCTDGCDFTIIVGKAATGPERSVTSGFRGLNCGSTVCEDSCGPCANPCQKPCK
ncbi:hypothetical protein [Clostridium sp.]|uniref:hypothetical protein n=1 Tax=Clostridium sp. TaxID=1506 RepID=UPI003F2BA252